MDSLGVTQDQQSAVLDQADEALEGPLLRGAVEVDEHVPAEDDVERTPDGPPGVHEVDLAKRHEPLDSRFHAHLIFPLASRKPLAA